MRNIAPDRPTMPDTSALAALPDALVHSPRVRYTNWRWLLDRESGRWAKRPWRAGQGFKINGHDYDSALTYDDAMNMVDERTGLGIVTGDGEFVVIDIDVSREYAGERLAVTDVHGQTHELPWYVAQIATLTPGYAEISPSGRGLRLIVRGQLPTLCDGDGVVIPHPTRWAVADTLPGRPDLTDGVAGEVYTARRWLTLTGRALGNRLDEDGTEWLRQFHAMALQDAHQEKATKRARIAPIAIDPATVSALLERALTRPKFRALYVDGDLDTYHRGDHSRADLALCLMLASVTGGDAGQMDALFRQSALIRDKWDVVHGHATYGDMTVQKALDKWDGQVWGSARIQTLEDLECELVRRDTPTGESIAREYAQAAWSAPELATELVMDTMRAVRGTSVQRNSYRDVMMDVLERVQAGEFSIEDGRIRVHLGGLRQLAERIGGQPTHRGQQLAFLGDSGFFAAHGRTAEGSPIVWLPLDPADLPIRRCSKSAIEALTWPSRRASSPRPRTIKAATAAEDRPRQAPTRVPTPLRAARWVAMALSAGPRSVSELAATTGTGAAGVRSQLRGLAALGHATRDGRTWTLTTPLAELDAARREELRAAHARTTAARAEQAARHRNWQPHRTDRAEITNVSELVTWPTSTWEPETWSNAAD